MLDAFGRRIHYLRLSVTDRCDFRCVYCMPEQMQFLPRKAVLSLEELAQVAKAFTDLGVDKIRVTGGEPLIRQNVISLFHQLGVLPLRDLALTTNGSQLKKLAEPLKQAGVTRLNISLDSLNPLRFKALTRHGDLDTVIAGIDHARDLGFEHIKINAVALKHFNADEVIPLAQFALERDLDIAFIEEMPLGEVKSHDRKQELMTSTRIREALSTQLSLEATNENTGGPARYWRANGYTGRIGFISPMSHNFCASCNRVRVSATGRLLLCLGNEHGVELKPILRAGLSSSKTQTKLKDTILKALQVKPKQHLFVEDDAPQIVRFMNATGG